MHSKIHLGLKEPYFLDQASIWCGKALAAKPKEHILDMCSAPGGKALIIALAMKGQGRLVLNDRSRIRRKRLYKVMATLYNPPEINIYGHDAKKWGIYEQSTYDRILLDAPCSSERHVLSSPHHLKQWRYGRLKNLARDQYALICSGLKALKIGGTMVYSTCSLSREENDGVIEKLLKKNKFSLDIKKNNLGESTEYGHIVLPDQKAGLGPLYWAKLIKLSD